MENRFNLVEEKWVPLQGGRDVSLKEIFENKEKLPNLRGNPIEKISLMKFLLAITHSAYTPKDYKDWENLGPKGMAQKTLDYLNSKKDLFWLYGDKPFLQFPEIKEKILQDNKEKNKDVKNIGNADFPNLPNENNTLIFDRDFNSKIEDSKKIIFIISSLSFSLAGKQCHMNHNKPSKVGPSLGRNCYLHSFIKTENLIDTIYLNWITEEDLKKFNFINGIGEPIWEKQKNLSKNSNYSYFEILMPLSRLFYIYKDGLYMIEGIQYPNFKDGWRELTLCFNDKKVLNVDTEKKPWRELTSLLSFINTNSNNNLECPQIKLSLEKAKENKNFQVINIWSGGLKVSGDSFGQKIKSNDSYIESEVNINLDWLGKEWFEKLKKEMQNLDDIATELDKKISDFYKNQKSENGKEISLKATNYFWQFAEKDFNKLLEICNLDEEYEKEQEKIRKKFIAYALDCYNIFCPHNTARQIEAWAKNRPYFKGGNKNGKRKN